MRVLQVVAIFLAAAVSAQQAGVCDVKDDDCADVINPNACYNQFRFNAQTLQCIDGKDNADRARKACKCCGCVGAQMCTWATSQRLCSGGAGGGAAGGAAAGGGVGGGGGGGGGFGKGKKGKNMVRAPRRGLEFAR